MLLSPCRDMGWMMFDVFSCHGCCSRRSKNASIAPTRMLKASAARVKRANALMGAWSLPRLALDGNQAHRPVRLGPRDDVLGVPHQLTKASTW